MIEEFNDFFERNNGGGDGGYVEKVVDIDDIPFL